MELTRADDFALLCSHAGFGTWGWTMVGLGADIFGFLLLSRTSVDIIRGEMQRPTLEKRVEELSNYKQGLEYTLQLPDSHWYHGIINLKETLPDEKSEWENRWMGPTHLTKSLPFELRWQTEEKDQQITRASLQKLMIEREIQNVDQKIEYIKAAPIREIEMVYRAALIISFGFILQIIGGWPC